MPLGATLTLLVLAAALSAALTPVVIKLCRKYNTLDQPDERKVHTRGIPRLGGVALFCALSLGIVATALSAMFGYHDLTAGQAYLLQVIYLGLVGFFLIGFFDDLRDLPALGRLAAQLVVALGVVLGSAGAIRIGSLFGTLILPDWLAVALTVIWIVGVANTFNWIDGLDGLASGIALISATAFLAIGALEPQLPNAVLTVALCAVIIGTLAGFLPYNFQPARIFIGDGGAFSLGYMLAVISVVGLFKQAAVISFIIPVAILALPLGDTLFAIIRRLWRRQPITKPDNRHIHHRILGKLAQLYRRRLGDVPLAADEEERLIGRAHRHTVLALYTLALLFAGVAVTVGMQS